MVAASCCQSRVIGGSAARDRRGWSPQFFEQQVRRGGAAQHALAADAQVVSQTDNVTDWTEWSRQAVAVMQARNEAWISRFDLGHAPYRWDLVTAELRFERATDHVVADLCLVGTVSEQEGTFVWAWDNDAIPATAKRGLDVVRTFGTTHDLPRLITPEWPGGRADGLEMLAIAGRIQEASGGFVDKEGGVLLFFTLRHFRVRPRPGADSGAAD